MAPRLALVVLLALAACSPCRETDRVVGPVCVDDSKLSDADRAVLDEELKRALVLGVAWWSGMPTDLVGWRIVFEVDPAATRGLVGLTEDETIRLLRPQLADGCPAGLVFALPHEIGHVVLGERCPWITDANHRDDRWQHEDRVLDVLLEGCEVTP